MIKLSQADSNKIRNMALICACFVVFIHQDVIAEVGSLAWWTRQMIGNGICRVALPFFFFKSGFFLAKNIECADGGGAKREVLKRFRTLLIPYLCLCCIAVVWARLTVGFDFTLKNVISAFGFNLLKNPASGVLWFVRTIIIFAMLTPAFIFVVRRKYLMVAVLLACGIGEFYTAAYGNTASQYVTYSYFSYFGPVWFLIGIYHSSRGISFPVLTNKQSMLAFIIICLAMLCYGFALLCSHQLLARFLIITALPVVFICFYNLVPHAQWPIALTSLSFPIYVLQRYAKSPVLWAINRDSYLFDVFHKTALGHLMIPLFTCCIAAVLAICIRKACPKVAQVIFGGR